MRDKLFQTFLCNVHKQVVILILFEEKVRQISDLLNRQVEVAQTIARASIRSAGQPQSSEYHRA